MINYLPLALEERYLHTVPCTSQLLSPPERGEGGGAHQEPSHAACTSSLPSVSRLRAARAPWRQHAYECVLYPAASANPTRGSRVVDTLLVADDVVMLHARLELK
jgi:hypothetical protein